MPFVIQCPKCSKRYHVADGHAGKQVRCQQCQTDFVATAPAAAPAVDLFSSSDPLTGGEFSTSPTDPFAGANSLGAPAASAPGNPYPTAPRAARPRVSNPSGGPTDAGMRLASVGMLAFGFALTVGSFVVEAYTGSVYLFVIGLVPLLIMLGVAGLISPNVVRAMGQFGGHLPSHYKVIGWGLMGASILVMLLIMFGLFVSGYQTDTPRNRRRARNINPVPPATLPTAPSTSTSTAKSKAVERPAYQVVPGAREDANGMKRRKSYPVSIAVPEHSVIVPSSAKLAPGTRLQACYASKWNPITTLSENPDGSLNVHWDDYSAHFDCSMVRSELIIRKDVLNPSGQVVVRPPAVSTPRPETAKSPGSAKSSAGVESKPKPLKSYRVSIDVPKDSQFVPASARLQPGTRLQACYAGKWNPITFLSENGDGTLTVRWDDYGPAFDCRMIRKELIIKNDVLK